jgi:hypothetical protein
LTIYPSICVIGDGFNAEMDVVNCVIVIVIVNCVIGDGFNAEMDVVNLLNRFQAFERLDAADGVTDGQISKGKFYKFTNI